ncbi:MAG: aspartate carbamoyltransferase [Oscillospiraceae bacterium]
MNHLIDPLDLTLKETNDLIKLAEEIQKSPEKYSQLCKGKVISTLFYEPSTRTRLSFEAAMLNLGGNVLGFSSADTSSASKGESVVDTIRTISCYSDICVMRHHKEGAPKVASLHSSIPVINAGDGGHQHPTQTLTDMLTISTYKNKLNNLTIGLCGDLKFGRTTHSLIKSLTRYENITFILISPSELKIPSYIINEIKKSKTSSFIETSSLEDVIAQLDVLYMTRVQKERFFNEEDYIRLKDSYILDAEKMSKAKKDMIVMHPMPRVNEIATEVDEDPRAHYFQQTKCGVYARMALILKMLNINLEDLK